MATRLSGVPKARETYALAASKESGRVVRTGAPYPCPQQSGAFPMSSGLQDFSSSWRPDYASRKVPLRVLGRFRRSTLPRMPEDGYRAPHFHRPCRISPSPQHTWCLEALSAPKDFSPYVSTMQKGDFWLGRRVVAAYHSIPCKGRKEVRGGFLLPRMPPTRAG